MILPTRGVSETAVLAACCCLCCVDDEAPANETPAMNGNAPTARDWRGQTLAQVCQRLGNPDLVEPAESYSAKFSGGTPSVVLTYHGLRKRWYLAREGRVPGVVSIKE